MLRIIEKQQRTERFENACAKVKIHAGMPVKKPGSIWDQGVAINFLIIYFNSKRAACFATLQKARF